jgi:tetratricopeptide (TPR) repeat protein
MQEVENLFLEVGKAIDDRDLAGAKELLEELLSIDPGYGRAHNHLGWIYETKIKDFDKAKRHYELALKFCNQTYPVVYVNYTYLLIEFGQLDQAEQIIEEGLSIEGADKATLIYQQGKIAEHRQNYVKAYKTYLKAQQMNFNKDFHGVLANEIGRIQMKMSFWQKYFHWNI